MKKYHFSVKFLYGTINYHGEFITSYKLIEDIIKKAKYELSLKLKVWNKKSEDIVMFEIYYFDDDKEINVFKFEK